MISRYNSPDDYNYQPIDTYVPLPFREMQEAIQRKQLERDKVEDGLAKLPSYLKADIEKDYYNSTGTEGVRNVTYDKYLQDANKYNNKINEASKLLEQGDVKGAKMLAGNIASEISNWRNNFAAQAENETKQYRTVRESIQKDKDFGRDKWRAVDFDLGIRNQATRDLSQGYQATNFTPQSSYIDLPKEIADVAKDVKLSTEERKSVREGLRNGFTTKEIFESNVGNNLNQVYAAAKPIIERATPYLQQKLVSSVINSPEHIKAMQESGYNPNSSNDVLTYLDNIPTTRTKKIKKDGKEIKVEEESTFYKDYINNEQSKLFDYSSAFAEFKDVRKRDFDYNPEFTQSDEALGKTSSLASTNLAEETSSTPVIENLPSNWSIASDNFANNIKNIKYDFTPTGVVSTLGNAVNKFTDDLAISGNQKITQSNVEQYNKILKNNLLMSMTDPLKRELAEKKLNTILDKTWTGTNQTLKEYGESIAKDFDKDWRNIITDVAVVPNIGKHSSELNKDLIEVVNQQLNLGEKALDKEGKELKNRDEDPITNVTHISYGDKNTGSLVFNTKTGNTYSVTLNPNSPVSQSIKDRNDILVNSYKRPTPVQSNHSMSTILNSMVNSGYEGLDNVNNEKGKNITFEVIANEKDPSGKSVLIKDNGVPVKIKSPSGKEGILIFSPSEIDLYTGSEISSQGLGLELGKTRPY